MEPMSEDAYRQKMLELADALPEVDLVDDQHITFKVRRRTFAYYQVDHHGDGMITLVCKAAPGAQEALVAASPDRYFVPSYLGARGWVGYDLEAPAADWSEVAELFREAYRLNAPRTLAAQVR